MRPFIEGEPLLMVSDCEFDNGKGMRWEIPTDTVVTYRMIDTLGLVHKNGDTDLVTVEFDNWFLAVPVDAVLRMAS